MRTATPGDRLRRRGLQLVIAAASWLAAVTVNAAEDQEDLTFADRSIEELLAMQVTSVAGVERSLFQTPSALTVISRDDIYRTGHRSIPEALRLVPGVSVRRTDSNTWSVGTRGFSELFGNKQLVLIDGRTTYDLLYSGTFWDVQDVMLEDLDRIEVIRGPGATLWGANAVNGVINVTTRSARDTQGLYASAGGGTYEKLFSEVRYGATLGERGWYRVWAKHFERAELDMGGDLPGNDHWRMTRGGFRADLEPADDVRVTLQGDAYEGDIGELSAASVAGGWARGHNVLGRVSRSLGGENGWQLQAYVDYTRRNIGGGFEVDRNTSDIDFRQNFTVGSHSAIWGAGYRRTSDDTRPSVLPTATTRFDPASRSAETFTLFVQDTIMLRPQRLYVMLGSKFEHNAFSGFEFQPSMRAWWTPDQDHTLWAALSRPLRTPSRTDDDLIIEVPGVLSFSGNPQVEPERLLAYELGYRHRFSERLSLDIAAFFHDYSRLVSTRGPFTDLTFDNDASAASNGIEVSTKWQPMTRWNLQGSYSYFRVRESNEPVDAPSGSAPRHMLRVVSDAQLTDRLHLDAALYWSDEILLGNIDANLRFDLGVSWQPLRDLAVRVRGQNLLDEGQPESPGDGRHDFPRAVYLELKFKH